MHIPNENKVELEFTTKDLGKVIDLEKPGLKEFVTILTKNKRGQTEERTYIGRGSHPGLASIASGFFNALTREEGLIQANQKEVEDDPFLGIVAAGTMIVKEMDTESKPEGEKELQDSLNVFFAGSSGRYGAILASQIPPHLNIGMYERREWWEMYENV